MKVTKEYLLDKGFKELGLEDNDPFFKIWFPNANGISPKELSGHFYSIPNNEFSVNGTDGFFTECSKERLNEIIKGIELINGKTIKELTGKE